MSTLETDVLVLGAGVAGLVTALNTRHRRVCVLWPGASEVAQSASDRAQGGIAAAVDADDSPELHAKDTIHAGNGLSLVQAVRIVCRGGPGAVGYLSSLGVGFARGDHGWSLHKEAAHSRARILHVRGDATGAEIMQVLRRHVAAASHIEALPQMRAISLLRNPDGICGVAAISDIGERIVVRAQDVVIATGGVGGLYSRTTNPLEACGDGLAMALAAGARCKDLEFVQFHPTALDVDEAPLPLMTEALRGAGARLVDEYGVSVTRSVHPLGDLAPRDVVARAVYDVQTTGRRVFLDATNLPDATVAETFPSVYESCRSRGINPDRDLVPITPAAHYHMGGIAVDLDGRTSLPRLWAVGEAACTGLHGANRLASNSLLEGVVFGRRAGRALDWVRHAGLPPLSPPIDWYGAPDVSSLRELRVIMWRRMGLIRSGTGLAEALSLIARLRELIPQHAVFCRLRLLLAEHMVLAALRRASSCGAHYRSDSAPVRRLRVT